MPKLQPDGDSYPWVHQLLLLVPLSLLLVVAFALPGPERYIPPVIERISLFFPDFTVFMDALSDYGNIGFYVFYAIAMAHALKTSNDRQFNMVLAYLICLAATLLTVEFLKAFIGRPRPFIEGDFTPFADTRRFESFPSGHVAETLVTVTPINMYFRKVPLTIVLSLWPAAMAFSRIYLCEHFPSDILGSLGLSLCGAIGFWHVFTWLCRSPFSASRCFGRVKRRVFRRSDSVDQA